MINRNRVVSFLACVRRQVLGLKECCADVPVLGDKKRAAESALDARSVKTLCLVTPGRSGTKSLVDWCAKNTTIYCRHAPKPSLATVGYLYHRKEVSGEAVRYAYYASRESYLLKAFEHDTAFLDGDCKNLPIVSEIAELLPNSKFIHLVRNPESFVLSGLSRGYYRRLPPQLWGHLEEGMDSGRVSFERQVEKVAWFWNEANQIAEAMKSRFGDKRVVTIVADQMFGDPSCVVRALDDLGFSEFLLDGRYRLLRKRNIQKKRIRLDGKRLEVVSAIVRDVCKTRSLYF